MNTSSVLAFRPNLLPHKCQLAAAGKVLAGSLRRCLASCFMCHFLMDILFSRSKSLFFALLWTNKCLLGCEGVRSWDVEVNALASRACKVCDFFP